MNKGNKTVLGIADDPRTTGLPPSSLSNIIRLFPSLAEKSVVRFFCKTYLTHLRLSQTTKQNT